MMNFQYRNIDRQPFSILIWRLLGDYGAGFLGADWFADSVVFSACRLWLCVVANQQAFFLFLLNTYIFIIARREDSLIE